MAVIDDLIAYYKNLLIKQYHELPNAQDTIGSLVEEMLSNLVWTQVQDAFDIDTAVGVQLDILGKYIGATRTQGGQNPALDDTSYRVVLKTKIAQNGGNQTDKSIDDFIWMFFENTGTGLPRIWWVDNLDMTITYYCSLFDKATMDYASINNLLPRPAGVATIINALLNPNGDFGYSLGGTADPAVNGYGENYTSYVGGTLFFIGA